MLRYIRRWCAAMEQRDGFRLVLFNLVFDLVKKRVPEGIGAALLRSMIESWQTAIGSDPDAHPEVDARAAAVLDDVLFGASADSFCQGPPVEIGATKISRITDHVGVWMNNIEKTAFAPPREGLPDARFWRDVEKHGLAEEHVIAGSTVRGARPFAWITTRETMAMIRETNPSDLANATRDHLGLDHFEMGAELLEVEYPEKEFIPTRIAAPTIIEGGANAVYQSVLSEDGWGRTRRLGGGDGGPEAVHTPIPFTHRFTLRYLGLVDLQPPPMDPTSLERAKSWSGNDAEILLAMIEQNSR